MFDFIFIMFVMFTVIAFLYSVKPAIIFMKEVYEDIQMSFSLSPTIDIFRNIKWFFINIWIYRKFLFEDRWWDHWYFLNMMKIRLDYMQRMFTKYGHHVNSDRDVKEMFKCSAVLNRLLKNEYGDNIFKKHDEKWGEINIDVDENPNEDGLYKANLMRSKVTPETEEQEKKEFLELCEKEVYMEKQDIEYLFTMLRKHIKCWWD